MNFVLVHGGFHGGWCWREVARLLRGQGHAVSHPTQTGLGERSHLRSNALTLDLYIQDLVQHLVYEDLHDVVLVGHSFGGLAISGAAQHQPQRIRELVYLDALILPAPIRSCRPWPVHRPGPGRRRAGAGMSWPPGMTP